MLRLTDMDAVTDRASSSIYVASFLRSLTSQTGVQLSSSAVGVQLSSSARSKCSLQLLSSPTDKYPSHSKQLLSKLFCSTLALCLMEEVFSVCIQLCKYFRPVNRLLSPIESVLPGKISEIWAWSRFSADHQNFIFVTNQLGAQPNLKSTSIITVLKFEKTKHSKTS